jgi:tRNA pseudouridine32 synthase/23S rRNA pseudouridine746 synthase
MRTLESLQSLKATLDSSTYWYEGACPKTGERLRLPRTYEVEAIAHSLMRYLSTDAEFSREGKMYGILLAVTQTGERQVLKAFSGLLQGRSDVEGWVPTIPGRDQMALAEAQTLSALELIKLELLKLQQLPERQQYTKLAQQYDHDLRELAFLHQQRKQERHQQRSILYTTLTGDDLAIAIEQLDNQSRWDGIERRHLKQQRYAALESLRYMIEQADLRMHELKQQRKRLSQQLQLQLHTVYCLTNFAGESRGLQALLPHGSIPTGTGECCAPKLLHYAATHALQPLAMAEFWWGPPTTQGDKLPGQFYGACRDRCQPLMGFLLSGLSNAIFKKSSCPAPVHTADLTTLPIVYQDDWLIVIDKPAGLLSVPGRASDCQDSVLNRLRQLYSDEMLLPIHRLDQDTSGLLLLARDRQTYRHIYQQFQQRQVYKSYEAVLVGEVLFEQQTIQQEYDGFIDLPLWSDPSDRPYQKVDWQQGKSSFTYFKVLHRENNKTRVAFTPITGRTHQLRVHAAVGLQAPILGDRLYGPANPTTRLHLHAKELRLQHPQTQYLLDLKTQVPF